MVYVVLQFSTLCPVVNHPSPVLSLLLVTLMQADICVQIQTCVRGNSKPAHSTPHITVGVNVTFFPTSRSDGSLSECEDRKAVCSIMNTENKHHGEIMGNDPSLVNGLQFKLTFRIDCIEQTSISALMQAAVRRFKNTVEKKKS